MILRALVHGSEEYRTTGGRHGDLRIEAIEVRVESDTAPRQVIAEDDDHGFPGIDACKFDDAWLTAEDIDFDGYKDLKISSATGSADGNWTYFYYRFDPRTGRFKEPPWVLTLPSPDPATRTIRTSWHTASPEEEITYAVYGDSLEPIRRVKWEYDVNGKWRVVSTEELRNGRMVEVERRVVE